MVEAGGGSDKVFDGEELALADGGDDSLVGVGLGDAGELILRFDRDADVGGAAEFEDAGGAVVGLDAAGRAFAGDKYVFQPASAGSQSLLDRVEAI